MITKPSIQHTLKLVRNRLAVATLKHEALLSLFFLSLLASTVVWYEKTLYLSGSIRSIIAWGLLDLMLLAGLTIILRWFGIWRGWWRWVRFESLSHRIGYKISAESDRLLNALQLEREMDESPNLLNRDLMTESVRLVAEPLSGMNLESLAPRRYVPSLRLVIVGLGVILGSWLSEPTEMKAAVTRLIHPEIDYPTPTPFILLSLAGDLDVLGGDTVEVSFTGIDVVPTNIEMVWENKSGEQFSELLSLDGDRFSYVFEDIRDNVTYFARHRAESWFSPWTEIVTETHTISLSDRPIIEELGFVISPPEYTGDTPDTVGGNVADIAALEGSRVEFSGSTNLEITEAWVTLSGNQTPLPYQGKRFSGGFDLDSSLTMTISVKDERDVTNLNPIRYQLTALVDFPPTISVVLPNAETDLDETMLVALQFDITDDYGFSRAVVSYSIRHPEYMTPDDSRYMETIPGLRPDRRSQRLIHAWQLGLLSLVPGDEVHFQIEIDDNNFSTGPGVAISPTFIARVPTLTALFEQINNRTAQTETLTESVLEDLDEVQALIDELDLAFRDEEEISWEEQQTGKELLKNLEEILNTMESVQDQMSELGDKADDNDLFSESVANKYDELQDMLGEIMSPELQASMEALREAMEKLDRQQMQQSLKNLKFNADEFESQLDRYIDVFKRAMAEMKMDEVAQRLKQIVQAEENILEQAKSIDPSESDKLRDLAPAHEEQERALEAAKGTMSQAAEAIEPYSSVAADNLSSMVNGDELRDVANLLSAGSSSLSSGEQSESEVNLSEGKASLSDMEQQVLDIQAQFQTDNVDEMLKEFQAVMNQTLALSHQQEDLAKETISLRRNSPRVGEMALSQHQINQGHKQLIAQLMDLSRKTFAISPSMGRSMGKSQTSMTGAVEKLTENRPAEAAKLQAESMTALNETALAINLAMAKMQSSGSASGFQEFMDMMAGMAEGQGALNEQSLQMQLGQMGSMNQVQMMRRLKARQQQLAQSLDNVLQDYPDQSGGKSGGLGQAQQEMEEVIQEFNRRRVTRKTIEKQQNILNRLLDSQQSMTEQDFKEERKGKVATQTFAFDGLDGLPADLGQSDDLILQSMEKALRAGFSQEYQEMIRDYFQQLAGRDIGGSQ